MIELPEARTIARDLRKSILNKTIVSVGGNFTDHKFTFYQDDPEKYQEYLVGKQVTDTNGRNFYVEIEAEDYVLAMRDGANIRYYSEAPAEPIKKSKLLIEFDDGSLINVSTSMYCFIGVFLKDNSSVNVYYDLDAKGIGALDDRFDFDYFCSLLDEKSEKLSVKGFLATEQRIPGIGNGVTQDILFNAELNPRRKMNTLTDMDFRGLYNSVIATLQQMVDLGGRDTEKNIYGAPGGYQTILSSKTYKNGCPACESEIHKEQFLGGSIYYCPHCQK